MKITTSILRATRLFSYIQLARRRSCLKKWNWFASCNSGQVIGPHNEPLPWLTYPCIPFLQARIQPEMSILEFGGGNSTLWWARRTRQVVTVEHKREWYDRLKCTVPHNVQLLHAPIRTNGEYCRAAAGFPDTFDIIVIDGRDRENCARQCLAALKDAGVIVWDDTGRGRYQAGVQWLMERGFPKIDFVGMKPCCAEESTTSVFYRRENCLGI